MKKLLVLSAVLTMIFTGCASSDSSSKAEISADENSAAQSAAESEIKEPRSIKLMPFGDSITEGFTYKGAYRESLANKLEENGLSQYVDFVGRKKGGDCYDNEHCGYTGYSIEPLEGTSVTGDYRSGLSELVEKFVPKYEPDVIMLQIGTNDILSLNELDTAGDRLEKLVDDILSRLPEDGMLFLATIPCMDATNNTYISAEHFTVEFMDQCVDEYNEKVKAIVEKKKSEGKNIELADVHSVITKEDLQDGVHPTRDGYAKLGEFWYGIISDFING